MQVHFVQNQMEEREIYTHAVSTKRLRQKSFKIITHIKAVTFEDLICEEIQSN